MPESLRAAIRVYCANVPSQVDARFGTSPGELERHAQVVVDAGMAIKAAPQDLVNQFRAVWRETENLPLVRPVAPPHVYTIALGVLLDRYFATRRST